MLCNITLHARGIVYIHGYINFTKSDYKCRLRNFRRQRGRSNFTKEDFDENCDPENPRVVKYEKVAEAVDRIKSHINLTPCPPSQFQRDFVMHLYYKQEFLQKTGSFKERGCVNVLEQLPLDKRKIGIVVASIGNEAFGFCYHAAKMAVPLIVVMPNCVPIGKLQKCHSYGAKVIVQGSNLMEAHRYARAIARDKGLTYINGRDHSNMLAGYGTVALELLEQVPNVDAVLVPVGSGGLAAAIAAVIKANKPSCLVYGVQPESMPVFFKSLETGYPVVVPVQATMADAISVPNAGVNSFSTAVPLIDKMLLVKEDWIARAMLHLLEKERVVVEPAGACPLAAVIGNLVPELKVKNVVCILSGGNVDTIQLTRCIDRGLAAECRLVKFSVGIKNNVISNTQLLKLLANGGYNVVRHFRDNSWIEDETYTIERSSEREAAPIILHDGMMALWSGVDKDDRTSVGVGDVLASRLASGVFGLVGPRLLWVRIKLGTTRVFLVAAYAPVNSACAQELLFWESVRDVLDLAESNESNHVWRFEWMGWAGTKRDSYEAVLGPYGDKRQMKQVRLVCETRGLEHALELKRIIEIAYPCTSAFETEPFNDRRTCPCFVRKPL